MTKSKVLYIGVGNPSKPRKGMDLVLEAHLDEISVLNDVDLMGLYVSPIDDGVLQSTRWSPLITAFMPDSMSGMRGLSRALRTAMFVLCGGFLPAYEFKSKEARHFVEDCLRNEKPKCIIIDHFFSLVNIGLWQIIRAVIIDKTKLIYIAHDATPILLQDIGKLKRGVAARLVYAIQALQAWFVEILLFRIAALVVFLSAFDRAWFGRWVGSGALVLCPIIREGKPAPEEYDGSYAPQFLFVGGADFPPNAFAIHWICSKLAPHLQMISSQVSILLVGKGVEKLAGTIASNVRPLGIVSDAELLRLLHSSAAIICPIVHGSGLKIKILEALSSGCPVFATAESLRGFEFMQVTPMLDLGDVSTTSSMT